MDRYSSEPLVTRWALWAFIVFGVFFSLLAATGCGDDQPAPAPSTRSDGCKIIAAEVCGFAYYECETVQDYTGCNSYVFDRCCDQVEGCADRPFDSWPACELAIGELTCDDFTGDQAWTPKFQGPCW